MGLSVLFSLLLGLTAPRNGRAAPVEREPLAAVFCAALLVAPEFESLGRARPPRHERASDDVSVGEISGLITELAAQRGLRPRRLTFNREFTGASDIKAYLDSVFALSDELQASIDSSETKFWSQDRVRLAVKTARYPALSASLLATVALKTYFLHSTPMDINVMAVFAALLLGYLRGEDFVQTGRYVQSVVDLRARVRARNHEGIRATEIRKDLREVRDETQAETTSNLLAQVPPALSDLMLDTPGPDDVPAVTENYRRLLHERVRELGDYKSDAFSHSYFVDFETYVDADAVPHLLVSVSMIRIEPRSHPPASKRRRISKRMKVTPGGLIPAGI